MKDSIGNYLPGYFARFFFCDTRSILVVLPAKVQNHTLLNFSGCIKKITFCGNFAGFPLDKQFLGQNIIYIHFFCKSYNFALICMEEFLRVCRNSKSTNRVARLRSFPQKIKLM